MSEILTWAFLMIYNALLWRPPPLQRLNLWETLGGPIQFSLCPLTLWFLPLPAVHVNSQVTISNLFHLHLKTFWACKHSYCWVLFPEVLRIFFGCFSFTLQSHSSQTISAGLRSEDCGGRAIWRSAPSLCFLVKQPLRCLKACLGSLSCWKTNHGPTKHKPDGMARHRRIARRFSVPWILNESSAASPRKHPLIVVTPPPAFVHSENRMCTNRPLGNQKSQTSTVQRRLCDSGLYGWIAAKKALLRQNNNKERIVCTKKHDSGH